MNEADIALYASECCLCCDRYTKMGYAGNTEPNYIVPTVISNPVSKPGLKTKDCQVRLSACSHKVVRFIHKDVKRWESFEYRRKKECIGFLFSEVVKNLLLWS